MSHWKTQVLIVGGGPAGLVLAIELGRRGVPCILFEEDPCPPTFPKANASTSRTMEHYRRLGFVDEIRPLGLPDDYPNDVSYHTRFAAHEIARLRRAQPSRSAGGPALSRLALADSGTAPSGPADVHRAAPQAPRRALALGQPPLRLAGGGYRPGKRGGVRAGS